MFRLLPAVRTAWAEAFKLSRKFASPERLAGALRLMGFDYVFDTTYAADLTIMEEGSEFLERLKLKKTTSGQCLPPAVLAGFVS